MNVKIENNGSPRWLAGLLAVAALTASSAASADEPPRAAEAPPPPAVPSAPPSTGTGAGVVGSVLAVGGLATLIATPFCVLVDNDGTRRRCLAGTAIAGVTGIAAGMPLLALAISQRAAFKEWQTAHPGVAGLGFSAGKGAGFLTWSAQF